MGVVGVKIVTYKEVARLKVNSFSDRHDILRGLNNSGYGTRIEEVQERSKTEYFIVVFEVVHENN